MKWQLVGKEELWETGTEGKGYAYRALLWRTPVPGGWLLMAVNAKHNSPDPVVSFYPDPGHVWTGRADAQAETLLRPAGGQSISPQEAPHLLRPAGDEPV